MARHERLRCSNCQGQLERPLRSKCPHCGSIIKRIRLRRPSAWWPQIIISALFALLVLFVLWITGK